VLTLDLGQSDSRKLADACGHSWDDFVYILSLAASLVLAVGAIRVLLFWM
jgi:hypothetical protein